MTKFTNDVKSYTEKTAAVLQISGLSIYCLQHNSIHAGTYFWTGRGNPRAGCNYRASAVASRFTRSARFSLYRGLRNYPDWFSYDSSIQKKYSETPAAFQITASASIHLPDEYATFAVRNRHAEMHRFLTRYCRVEEKVWFYNRFTVVATVIYAWLDHLSRLLTPWFMVSYSRCIASVSRLVEPWR